MANPLSRREVLKFGAYTTVGGVLTPGVSLAQATVTDTKGITARDVQLSVGGTMIPGGGMRGMSGLGGMPGHAGMHQQMGSMMSTQG